MTQHRVPLASALLLLLTAGLVLGVEDRTEDKFRQLGELLPTPGATRTASGAPGREYWQQRADYRIEVSLDDAGQRVTGSETITYHNQSPDDLDYLWVQLDPNLFAPESHSVRTALSPDLDESPTFRTLERELGRASFDGGIRITRVEDSDGGPLPHSVTDTMMRIDLDRPLQSGESFGFDVDWDYAVNDHDRVGGRTGYEWFEDDQNFIYEIAQWYPRMAAYTDQDGWQNKPYLGRGEFTLEFGDFDVAITVPEDHVVAATGVLQNPDEVLDEVQRERLEQARGAERPVFVITPEEALRNEESRATGTRTWRFRAENVRDFAFASSRKFIWDAVGHEVGDRRVLAMSFYPKEGEPLWSRYSTHAVVHTLDVYSEHTFPYPYPVAISVNGPVGGMEYPMICFNGPRPEKDGTYSKVTKYDLISTVIHEVGHNWFPMVVNSDERQWTWMDEGLNSFLQYLAEQAWEEDYPSWCGEPKQIVEYMESADQRPIMTNSESILQFAGNAYFKPATALNVLRETVLGRKAFDFAFQQYARRWEFRRPEPADLFRTLEDATAVDLDWFWRGWFFTTDHTDMGIEGLRLYRVKTGDPDVEAPLAKAERDAEPETISEQRNRPLPKRIDAFPELADFYNAYDELDPGPEDYEAYSELLASLDEDERDLLGLDLNLYVVDLANRGGLVMPVILELEYEDGTRETRDIPAEIWRRNDRRASKLILSEKRITRIVLDPHLQTPDTDRSDNEFPPAVPETRIELERREEGTNPMREAAEAKAKQAEAGTSAQGS